MGRQTSAIVASLLLLGGCARAVELYSGLSEVDANEIVAALTSHGLQANKSATKQGFVVSLEDRDLAEAVSLLQAQGLPRHAYAGMGDVFRKDGMISTPTEERARYLYALSQELENTLSNIDGVVLARVHPVLPERLAPGEPMLPSSCAVLIKYQPGWDSDTYEERIRQLVIASIPGLAGGGKVSIVFVPASNAHESNTNGARRGGDQVQGQVHASRPVVAWVATILGLAGCTGAAVGFLRLRKYWSRSVAKLVREGE
jgi:type III secretion protein J